MGKRKRQSSAELPLFDLPLQSDEADPSLASSELLSETSEFDPSNHLDQQPLKAREQTPHEQLIPAVASSSPREPAAREQDSPEVAAEAPEEPSQQETPPQLDLLNLGSGTDAASERLEGAESPEATDDSARPGDRLLGGLADFAVQILMLGIAIAAAHALGVGVTLADWIPFAVLALVFSFLYWVVPLAFWGRTPGMAWVGHTARAPQDQPLTFGQASLRWLGALCTLALAGLPFLLALTGRSLTDRISNSSTRSA